MDENETHIRVNDLYSRGWDIDEIAEELKIPAWIVVDHLTIEY